MKHFDGNFGTPCLGVSPQPAETLHRAEDGSGSNGLQFEAAVYQGPLMLLLTPLRHQTPALLRCRTTLQNIPLKRHLKDKSCGMPAMRYAARFEPVQMTADPSIAHQSGPQ